jgi:hypothetical protein
LFDFVKRTGTLTGFCDRGRVLCRMYRQGFRVVWYYQPLALILILCLNVGDRRLRIIELFCNGRTNGNFIVDEGSHATLSHFESAANLSFLPFSAMMDIHFFAYPTARSQTFRGTLCKRPAFCAGTRFEENTEVTMFLRSLLIFTIGLA